MALQTVTVARDGTPVIQVVTNIHPDRLTARDLLGVATLDLATPGGDVTLGRAAPPDPIRGGCDVALDIAPYDPWSPLSVAEAHAAVRHREQDLARARRNTADIDGARRREHHARHDLDRALAHLQDALHRERP